MPPQRKTQNLSLALRKNREDPFSGTLSGKGPEKKQEAYPLKGNSKGFAALVDSYKTHGHRIEVRRA